MSDNPKDARAAALKRFDGLAAARLPLTQEEIEASRMFDFTAYHHAGEEEEKLCAENVFKQYVVRITGMAQAFISALRSPLILTVCCVRPVCVCQLDPYTPLFDAPTNAPRPKATGPFAAQIQGDLHWKDLHEWITNGDNFRKYIAAARSCKVNNSKRGPRARGNAALC